MEQLQLKSSIMGFHEYKGIWTPQTNQKLKCEMEPTNPKDKYAVAAKLEEVTVGHLPLGKTGRFAKTIFYFLKGCNENSCTATITGSPFNLGKSKGMEVPCLLTFVGRPSYINLLKKTLIDS